MTTYEITRPDAEPVTLAASGYTWNYTTGSIAFFDAQGRQLASYDKGEWTALHMRSPPEGIGLAPTSIFAVGD
jgi:hypothetical protein